MLLNNKTLEQKAWKKVFSKKFFVEFTEKVRVFHLHIYIKNGHWILFRMFQVKDCVFVWNSFRRKKVALNKKIAIRT